MIDKCIILSLDKREALWTQLYKDCCERNFDTETFIVGDGSNKGLKYDHIDESTMPVSWKYGNGISSYRHWLAFESHRKIIAKSIKKNYNKILLMEDDCIFVEPRFSKHWPEIVDFINKEDPDLLYLGSHFGDYSNHLFSGNNITIEEEYKHTGKINFIPIKQCGGLFACIISKRMFTVIMNMPTIAPIDSQLNNYRSLIKSYNVVPVVCYVRSGFSSCENCIIQRDLLS